DDTMQCRVSTAVPAPIEAVPGGFAGGGGNGRYPAQGGERGLGSHPVRVAPAGDDQLRSHDAAHPVHSQQERVMGVEDCEQLVFQHLGTWTGINMSLGKMFPRMSCRTVHWIAEVLTGTRSAMAGNERWCCQPAIRCSQ